MRCVMSRENYHSYEGEDSLSILLHNPPNVEEIRVKKEKRKKLSRFLLAQMEYDRIRKNKNTNLDYFPKIGEGAEAGKLSFPESRFQNQSAKYNSSTAYTPVQKQNNYNPNQVTNHIDHHLQTQCNIKERDVTDDETEAFLLEMKSNYVEAWAELNRQRMTINSLWEDICVLKEAQLKQL